jgi:heme a synthase
LGALFLFSAEWDRTSVFESEMGLNLSSNEPATRIARSPHWVAVFAAVFTWPLLLVGGTVSVYRFGLAVPDWPTTFQMNMFLYRFWDASWAVFVEHGHRLYGAAVGIACIILAVWFGIAENRRWMKVLGVTALLAVIAQGLLGGLRVTHTSTTLAFVHGCTAQAFFAFMVALCVWTGRDWSSAAKPIDDPMHLRRRSVWTLSLAYAQIIAGAYVRHFGTIEALVVHAVLGAAVWGHAVALAIRVIRNRTLMPSLVPSAWAMATSVGLQVALGVVAWWMLRPFDGLPRAVSPAQALVRVGHQGVGALLLAATVILSLRSYRHFSSPEGATRRAHSLELEPAT